MYLDEWRGAIPFDGFSWLRPCEEKKREISRDKVPCTRMAAVVGAQRDRARARARWRDSYLFPTEVDWNIFYRVGPHPRILLPLPELLPSGALSRRAETREQEARTWRIFFMGKMATGLFLSLSFLCSRPWTSHGSNWEYVLPKRIKPRRALRGIILRAELNLYTISRSLKWKS